MGLVPGSSHQTLFSGPPGDSVSYSTISNESSKDASGGCAPPTQGSKPRKKTEMGGGGGLRDLT